MILTFVGVLAGVILPLVVLPAAVVVVAAVVVAAPVATATPWLMLGLVAPPRARASSVPILSRRP